jgi:hypothetical protein
MFDEGRRLDGFLGKLDVAKTRKENHTGLEEIMSQKSLLKLSSRLAQPHAKVRM